MKVPKLPAPFATFLLRIPLSALFLQKGLSKFPVNQQTADAFELPFIVWWFVAYGEVGSAIGLIVGGILGIIFTSGFISTLADTLTRFSGVTMTQSPYSYNNGDINGSDQVDAVMMYNDVCDTVCHRLLMFRVEHDLIF